MSIVKARISYESSIGDTPDRSNQRSSKRSSSVQSNRYVHQAEGQDTEENLIVVDPKTKVIRSSRRDSSKETLKSTLKMLKNRRKVCAHCCGSLKPNEKIQKSARFEDSRLETFEALKKYLNEQKSKYRSQTGDGFFRNVSGKLEGPCTFSKRKEGSNVYEDTLCSSSSNSNLMSSTRRAPKYEREITNWPRNVRRNFDPEDNKFCMKKRQASFCPPRRTYSSSGSKCYDSYTKRRPRRPDASSTTLNLQIRNQPSCFKRLGKLDKYYEKWKVRENSEVTDLTSAEVTSTSSRESWSSSRVKRPVVTSSPNSKSCSKSWNELSRITQRSSGFKVSNEYPYPETDGSRYPEEEPTSRFSTHDQHNFTDDADLDTSGISSFQETPRDDLKSFDNDEEYPYESTEEEPFTRTSASLFQSTKSPVNRCCVVDDERLEKKSKVRPLEPSYLSTRSRPQRCNQNLKAFPSPEFLNKSTKKSRDSVATTKNETNEFKYGTSGVAPHFSEEKLKKPLGKFGTLEKSYDVKSNKAEERAEEKHEEDRCQCCWCQEKLSRNESHYFAPWRRSKNVDDEDSVVLPSSRDTRSRQKYVKLKENLNDVGNIKGANKSHNWRNANRELIRKNGDQNRHDVSKDSSGYFCGASSNEQIQLDGLLPNHWKELDDHLSKMTKEYKTLTSQLKTMKSKAEEAPAERRFLQKRVTRRCPFKTELSFDVKDNPKSSRTNNIKTLQTPKSFYDDYQDSVTDHDIYPQLEESCRNYVRLAAGNPTRFPCPSGTRWKKGCPSKKKTNLKKRTEPEESWKLDPVRTLESFCERVKTISGRETNRPIEQTERPSSRCPTCRRVSENIGSSIAKTSETKSGWNDTPKTRCCSSRRSEGKNEQAHPSIQDEILVFPPGDEDGPPLTLFKNSSNIDCRVRGIPETGFRYQVTYTQEFISSFWHPKTNKERPPREKTKNKKHQCCMDHG